MPEIQSDERDAENAITNLERNTKSARKVDRLLTIFLNWFSWQSKTI